MGEGEGRGGESFLGQEPGPPLAEPPGKAILQMEGINGAGEGPTVIGRKEGGVCVCLDLGGGERQTHQTRRKWKRRRRNRERHSQGEDRQGQGAQEIFV